MSKARDKAVEGRSDLSRFVVHLTRDDTSDFENGDSAEGNFRGIVDDREILALRPHCLYADRISKGRRKHFSVCCFTEAPLTEIHHLVRRIPGRQIELSEYGFVFSREFVVARGAQPALYVSSYHGNTFVREAADRLFEMAQEGDFRRGRLWRLLPYLNAMHEGYDFAWEREWRLRGNLRFESKDVVCVILPEDGEEKLKKDFLAKGVPVISPGWSAERIVWEFSMQARGAQRLWLAKSGIRRRRKAK